MYKLAMQGTAKNYGINKDKLLTEPWLTGGLTKAAADRSETLTSGAKKPLRQQIPVSPAL